MTSIHVDDDVAMALTERAARLGLDLTSFLKILASELGTVAVAGDQLHPVLDAFLATLPAAPPIKADSLNRGDFCER